MLVDVSGSVEHSSHLYSSMLVAGFMNESTISVENNAHFYYFHIPVVRS